jgi:hypothetical protein
VILLSFAVCLTSIVLSRALPPPRSPAPLVAGTATTPQPDSRAEATASVPGRRHSASGPCTAATPSVAAYLARRRMSNRPGALPSWSCCIFHAGSAARRRGSPTGHRPRTTSSGPSTPSARAGTGSACLARRRPAPAGCTKPTELIRQQID